MSPKAPFTFGPVPNSIALFKEVADAVQVYLDMLYTGDTALVDVVFHERAQLCTIENAAPLFRYVAEYRAVLGGRPIPPWPRTCGKVSRSVVHPIPFQSVSGIFT